MMRSLLRCGALALVGGLVACELEVLNTDEPTTVQVKQTPADLENYLGTQYRRWHSALYGVTGNIWGMANVMSFENFSTLSNNCQGQRVGIPRPVNNNQVGSPCSGEQALIYNRASEVARGVSDVLRRLNESGGTLFATAADDSRNRAFAEFLRGLSLGYLALVYDSAAIMSPDDPIGPQGTAEPQELSHYTAVIAAAIEALDNAQAAAAGMSNLPANWMFWAGTGSTATPVPEAEFVRIIRSYRARLRASVARTPTERAAVNWDAVIADAQNGITADHRIVTNTVTDPRMVWVNQWYSYVTWHQMSPFIVGMGDVSGAYEAWLAEPLTTRGSAGRFFMITPDQRFPQGATRAEQQGDFRLAGVTGSVSDRGCSGANQTCKRYFRNRDVSDPPASPAWGGSQYDHTRHYSWRTAGSGGTAQNGPFPFFTKAELDLLKAEGHFRKGEYQQAADLVNLTRTACGPTAGADQTVLNFPAGCTTRPAGNGRVGDPGGGLPAVTADPDAPVPGGPSECVPKRPVNANAAGAGTVVCGTLWDALKWEKRLETAYTHLAPWFFDNRGWGDLVEGTPLDWAPPFAELQARFRVGSDIYSPTALAGPSTYGW